MTYQLYIYDCLNEKLRASDSSFMTLGAGNNTIFRVAMEVDNAGSFAQRDGSCRFFPHSKIRRFSLNGIQMKGDALILPNALYLMTIAGGCVICWYGEPNQRPDFSQLNPKAWFIHDAEQEDFRGPFRLHELVDAAPHLPADTLVTFQGLSPSAFYLGDIMDVARFKQEQMLLNQAMEEEEMENRLYLCPSCWENFNKEEALSIATHPDLCGDDIMGEDAQLRFKPSRFNEYGVPVDEMGSPCIEFACPHCHHKLPPFFTQMNQHIISLVGIPAAGKTYYLSSLIHELGHILPREFNLPFRDADPINNAILNDMSLRLFSGKSPQEAYLGKTRLDGNLYQKVWRHQHYADMPRPFIYNLNKSEESYSVVMYDNAGENYEPGRSGEDYPGAEHLSIASGILYLFDPTSNLDFRNLLQDNKDPQMQRSSDSVGRQRLLLAETEMRLRTRRNIHPGKKLDLPLAIIIGKCDIWQHLLGPEPLLPVVRNGLYMPEHVNANSARLRQFLFKISPNICSNAEAISDNVRYFAVSSFGKSPIEIVDEATGQKLLAPDTSMIKPMRVIDPLVWALQCCEPALFPCSQK